MTADASGLVELADQAMRKSTLWAGETTTDGVPAVVEAINGLTFAVLALVATSIPPSPNEEVVR